MKVKIQSIKTQTSNIKVNKSLTSKYKEANLFSNKLKWAKDHFKNRDVFKELSKLSGSRKYQSR